MPRIFQYSCPHLERPPKYAAKCGLILRVVSQKRYVKYASIESCFMKQGPSKKKVCQKGSPTREITIKPVLKNWPSLNLLFLIV